MARPDNITRITGNNPVEATMTKQTWRFVGLVSLNVILAVSLATDEAQGRACANCSECESGGEYVHAFPDPEDCESTAFLMGTYNDSHSYNGPQGCESHVAC